MISVPTFPTGSNFRPITAFIPIDEVYDANEKFLVTLLAGEANITNTLLDLYQ